MTAKHDFIEDNSYLAYAPKGDTATVPIKFVHAVMDGDGNYTTNDDFEEFLAYTEQGYLLILVADVSANVGAPAFTYAYEDFHQVILDSSTITFNCSTGTFEWNADGLAFND